MTSRPSPVVAGRPTPALVTLVWRVTGIALVVVAVFWAGSKRRQTGDTWVGLAGGRLICERGYFNFPLEDHFSFTHAGQVWTNQNWLVHVLYWLAYKHLGPAALVGIKLGLVLVMLLAMWRCGLLLSGHQAASLLTACAGLLCAREFIDIRPNQASMVFVALLFWLLMLVKRGRGWAACLTAVLMLIWGSAHGSFLLGYALLILFVGCEALQRVAGRRGGDVAWWTNLLWLLAAAALSVVLVWWSSPYGWSNFTHPLVIMFGPHAKVFQGVMEWQPPSVSPKDWWTLRPVVGGFWITLLGCAVIWLAAGLAWLRPGLRAETGGTRHPSGFDLSEAALTGVTLALALQSRRFIPLFIVVGLPVTARLLATVLRGLGESVERGGVGHPHRPPRPILVGFIVAHVVLIATFAGIQWDEMIQSYYVRKTDQPYGRWLLNTHVAIENEPVELVSFAKRYGLSGPVFNEWTWGGYLMFNAPGLKLFIDGRAQALYSAEFYRSYWNEFYGPEPVGRDPRERGLDLDRRLAGYGANFVLFKRMSFAVPRVINPLLGTDRWEPLMEDDTGILLVRATSRDPQIVELMGKYWAAELDWPDTVYGWSLRGHVFQNRHVPDHRRAVECFRRSLGIKPQGWLYERLYISWRLVGEPEEVRAYFRQERERIMALLQTPLEEPAIVGDCLKKIDGILGELEGRRR